ncbi:hypothetical protein PVAP13_9NG574128 [Panicum virgatum]|uniref:Secreted protein n=1 Tax=Panicum virgatum TaxID=38727 RepID=A0A8T0MV21_PANVG|nr:hypothetical protein PVAP13_9NG574128 [Panicum virgatum]
MGVPSVGPLLAASLVPWAPLSSALLPWGRPPSAPTSPRSLVPWESLPLAAKASISDPLPPPFLPGASLPLLTPSPSASPHGHTFHSPPPSAPWRVSAAAALGTTRPPSEILLPLGRA